VLVTLNSSGKGKSHDLTGGGKTVSGWTFHGRTRYGKQGSGKGGYVDLAGENAKFRVLEKKKEPTKKGKREARETLIPMYEGHCPEREEIQRKGD